MNKKKKRSGHNKKAHSIRPKKQKPLEPALINVLRQAVQYHQKGQVQMAEKGYRHILAHRPDSADANQFMGLLSHQVGQSQHAIPFFEKALKFAPNNASILCNFAVVLSDLGRFEEAKERYLKAIALQPRFGDAHYNLGKVYQSLNQLDKALSAFDKALAIDAKNVEAWNNRGNVLKDMCLWKAALESFEKALAVNPKYCLAASNRAMVSNYMEELSPEQVFALHEKVADIYPPEETYSFPANNREGRIRIGYLSSDLHTHSVAFFFLPLLENHDKNLFEIFCYYTAKNHDEMTLKIRSHSDHFKDCASLNDSQLLSLLRKDSLALLVDLNGHTSNNRLAVFSRRAARKQATWLGYPNTTGIPAMDYRIVDSVTDPEGEADKLNTEYLWRLPNGFLCYQGDEVKYSTALPCERKGHFTFGSFNNLAKVTEQVVKTWIDILRAVPNSKLIMKAKQLGDRETMQRYERLFEEGEIDLSRVSLVGFLEHRIDHLQLYNEIDLALDSFPYNGTTTTCEAMWMGVPTLTYSGDSHAARVGASILLQVGLDDFIASSSKDYISHAVSLASEPDNLATLRSTLRERMLASTLCDAGTFARSMETAYQQMVNA